jgi:hypothetical protein
VVEPPRIAIVAAVLFDGVFIICTFGAMPARSTTFAMSKSSMVEAVIAVIAIGVS